MAFAAVLAAGMQRLAGGALLGLLSGEWAELHLGQVSRASWLGFGYLVVFGSLVAFTACRWLMKNAPAARVATYACVNPVVAVLLGWAMLGERLTGQMLVGAVVIVGAVVLITIPSQKQARAHRSQLERRVVPCFMPRHYLHTAP